MKFHKSFGEERLEENRMEDILVIKLRDYICFIRKLPCLIHGQRPRKQGGRKSKKQKAKSKNKQTKKTFSIRKLRSFQKGSGSRQEGNVKFLLFSSSGQWRLILSYIVQTWNILLP